VVQVISTHLVELALRAVVVGVLRVAQAVQVRHHKVTLVVLDFLQTLAVAVAVQLLRE
jgi:hypothetical protein